MSVKFRDKEKPTGEKAQRVINIEGISKTFYLSDKHKFSLKEELVGVFGNLFSKNEKTNVNQEVRALQNISLSINKGERIAIIGKNGSGKSTLLKVLSGITTPTSGKIKINGTVGSLLELGSGFHPDLNGIDNIYFNASLLGISETAVKSKINEIIEFSGIGDFVYRPVKYYSNGMYLRLAFSIMVILDFDILLIDEILEVGDESFKIKSYNRIQELSEQGKTLILVSHNMSSIIRLCNRCVYLENGILVDQGMPRTIINDYIEHSYVKELMDYDEAEEDVIQDVFKTENTRDEGNQNTESTLRKDNVISMPEDKNVLAMPGESKHLRIEPAELGIDLTKAGANKLAVEHFENKKIQKFQQTLVWNNLERAPGNEKVKLMSIKLIPQNDLGDNKIYREYPLNVEIKYKKTDPNGEFNPALWIGSHLYGSLITTMPNLKYEEREKLGEYTSVCTIPANLFNGGIFFILVFILGNTNVLVYRYPRNIMFRVDIHDYDPENFRKDGNFPGPLVTNFPWKKSST